MYSLRTKIDNTCWKDNANNFILLPSATKLRRLCFYTCVCPRGGGGLPQCRGLPQCMLGYHHHPPRTRHPRDQAPPSRRLLLRTVRILLECILVHNQIFTMSPVSGSQLRRVGPYTFNEQGSRKLPGPQLSEHASCSTGDLTEIYSEVVWFFSFCCLLGLIQDLNWIRTQRSGVHIENCNWIPVLTFLLISRHCLRRFVNC